MAGIQLERDTGWLLHQWAGWAKADPELARIHYPELSPFVKMKARAGAKAYIISDDDALEIDQAIARLRKRDAEMGRATALFYWLGGNMSLTARVLGIHRKRVDVLIAAGTAWIDCAIS